jgi:hypothetical protein
MVFAVGDPCDGVYKFHGLVVILEGIGFDDFAGFGFPAGDLREEFGDLFFGEGGCAGLAGFAAFVGQG